MREQAGGWKGVARAVWVVAERNWLQVPSICWRLHHQKAVGTNHVKMFTVGEAWTIFHANLPSGGRG
jgi:hypothetical protein